MTKILLCFLSLFLISPVFAGQFEDAMKSNENVLLYIYTPQCGYCTKFNPNYKKLVYAYGQKCKFVKIDGTTQYGVNLAYQMRASYVPFVALIKTKTKKATVVPADCLLRYSCVNQKVNSFIR